MGAVGFGLNISSSPAADAVAEARNAVDTPERIGAFLPQLDELISEGLVIVDEVATGAQSEGISVLQPSAATCRPFEMVAPVPLAARTAVLDVVFGPRHGPADARPRRERSPS